MRLEVRTRGVEVCEKLDQHVQRRVRSALDRFAHRIREVRVHFTDHNGPKGGEDIECRIVATLSPGGEVVLRDVRENPFAAVAHASGRLARSLGRQLERRTMRRRARSR